jgi:hypothetical protein
MSDDEFNLRQMRIAKERIARYEREALGLGGLINDLTAIASLLRGLSSTDRNSLLSEIGTLEDIHASSLDRRVPLDAKDRARIAGVLETLKNTFETLCKGDYESDDAT